MALTTAKNHKKESRAAATPDRSKSQTTIPSPTDLSSRVNQSPEVNRVSALENAVSKSFLIQQVSQLNSKINATKNTLPLQLKLDLDGWGKLDDKTDSTELQEYAEAIFDEDWQYGEAGLTVGNIETILTELAQSGDHQLKEFELRELVTKRFGKDDSVDTSSKSEDDDKGFGSDDEKEDGLWIGKRFFAGDSYHITVKAKIISGIGEKELSLLVYKDSKHHNFDFWIGKNGEIWAGVNNSGGKELQTGYSLSMSNEVTKD